MKRHIIMLLLITLLLSACADPKSSVADSKPQESTENKYMIDFYQRYLEENANNIYSSTMLSSGGILVVQNFELNSGVSYSFDSDELHYLLFRIEAWDENKNIMWNTTPLQWADTGEVDGYHPTWIFYAAKNAKYDENSYENMKEYTYYDSHFFFLDGKLGRDLVVIVTPAMKSFLCPYSESPQYGIEPYDTLESIPMKIIDDTASVSYSGLWHYGYPIWVFTIPEKQIDDSYELHFGDYVLTGKDIKTGTWSIDGVTNPERPCGRAYYFGFQN